jgi:cyclase
MRDRKGSAHWCSTAGLSTTRTPTATPGCFSTTPTCLIPADTFGNTGHYNTIDFANGGDIRGLIRAVDAYIKVSNDNTKIVPGHGALAKKADLVAWRAMLVTSRERIEKLFNEGKTEQEVLAAKPLADLDATWAANEQQAQNWTRMVYNSFKRS